MTAKLNITVKQSSLGLFSAFTFSDHIYQESSHCNNLNTSSSKEINPKIKVM